MKALIFNLCLLLVLGCATGNSFADTTKAPTPPLKLQNSIPQHPQAPQFEDIRDIRDPVPLPDQRDLLLPLILGGAILLVAVLLFLFLKRKKPLPPPPDPGAIALAGLEAARTYMVEGQPLRYAGRISEILRSYIEERFHVRSTRQTTGEFLRCLTQDKDQAETPLHAHTGSLKDCLERCDMAKFAHNSPGNSDMELMENSVRSFVATTTPTETIQGGA